MVSQGRAPYTAATTTTPVAALFSLRTPDADAIFLFSWPSLQ
jgi:hypothetical protein